MNLSTLFPKIGPSEREAELDLVGTPEHPLVVDGTARILTGRPAQQSVQDRWKNKEKDEKIGDVLFPVNARSQRRALAAQDRRQAKKGRKAFVRRERAKEREVDQLAQLFSLIDGSGPPIGPRIRAQQAVNARIDYLLVQAIEADEATTVTHEQLEQKLRDVAATATLATPKVPQLRGEALMDFYDREMVRTASTGRTGRAG